MDTHRQLSRQRSKILGQIETLGPMRMGSVYDHYVPTKRKDGSRYRRGPYPTYTYKQNGKTRAKHLSNPEQAELYQSQIDNFRRYQQLSAQLVELSQRLADLEAADDPGCKKNSRR